MSRSTVDLRHKGYELPKHKTEATVCARRAPLSSRAVLLEAQAQFDGRDAISPSAMPAEMFCIASCAIAP